MIVPIPSGRVGYTSAALQCRVGDLDCALVALGRARVDPLLIEEPDNGFTIVSHLDELERDIRATRDDMYAVWTALEPAEATRRFLFGGALSSIGGAMTVVPWVWTAIRLGEAWAPLRLTTDAIEGTAPWTTPHPTVTTVTRAGEMTDVSAPLSVEDRVGRIPDGPHRVRIDRFASDDGIRFEVYIGGTDFGAASDDPWWAGSNLDLLASHSSRSVTATAEAMKLAGVTPQTPVVFTGHSQGGAVAIALARSGDYDVDAVFTVGTPVGLVGDSGSIPVVNIAHVNDGVPALGGAMDSNDETLWAIPRGHEWGIDAHLRETYRDTAAVIEEGDSAVFSTLEHQLRTSGRGTAMIFDATGVSN